MHKNADGTWKKGCILWTEDGKVEIQSHVKTTDGHDVYVVKPLGANYSTVIRGSQLHYRKPVTK